MCASQEVDCRQSLIRSCNARSLGVTAQHHDDGGNHLPFITVSTYCPSRISDSSRFGGCFVQTWHQLREELQFLVVGDVTEAFYNLHDASEEKRREKLECLQGNPVKQIEWTPRVTVLAELEVLLSG